MTNTEMYRYYPKSKSTTPSMEPMRRRISMRAWSKFPSRRERALANIKKRMAEEKA